MKGIVQEQTETRGVWQVNRKKGRIPRGERRIQGFEDSIIIIDQEGAIRKHTDEKQVEDYLKELEDDCNEKVKSLSGKKK